MTCNACLARILLALFFSYYPLHFVYVAGVPVLLSKKLPIILVKTIQLVYSILLVFGVALGYVFKLQQLSTQPKKQALIMGEVSKLHITSSLAITIPCSDATSSNSPVLSPDFALLLLVLVVGGPATYAPF